MHTMTSGSALCHIKSALTLIWHAITGTNGLFLDRLTIDIAIIGTKALIIRQRRHMLLPELVDTKLFEHGTLVGICEAMMHITNGFIFSVDTGRIRFKCRAINGFWCHKSQQQWQRHETEQHSCGSTHVLWKVGQQKWRGNEQSNSYSTKMKTKNVDQCVCDEMKEVSKVRLQHR